jgi:hypothetical protein
VIGRTGKADRHAELDRQNGTGRAEKEERDRQKQVRQTGHAELDRQNGGIGQAERYRHRTCRTGQAELDRQRRKGRTGYRYRYSTVQLNTEEDEYRR